MEFDCNETLWTKSQSVAVLSEPNSEHKKSHDSAQNVQLQVISENYPASLLKELNTPVLIAELWNLEGLSAHSMILVLFD